MWAMGLPASTSSKRIKTACLVAQGTMRRFNLHVGPANRTPGNRISIQMSL